MASANSAASSLSLCEVLSSARDRAGEAASAHSCRQQTRAGQTGNPWVGTTAALRQVSGTSAGWPAGSGLQGVPGTGLSGHTHVLSFNRHETLRGGDHHDPHSTKEKTKAQSHMPKSPAGAWWSEDPNPGRGCRSGLAPEPASHSSQRRVQNNLWASSTPALLLRREAILSTFRSFREVSVIIWTAQKEGGKQVHTHLCYSIRQEHGHLQTRWTPASYHCPSSSITAVWALPTQGCSVLHSNWPGEGAHLTICSTDRY